MMMTMTKSLLTALMKISTGSSSKIKSCHNDHYIQSIWNQSDCPSHAPTSSPHFLNDVTPSCFIFAIFLLALTVLYWLGWLLLMCCDRPPATTSPLPPMLQLQLPSTNFLLLLLTLLMNATISTTEWNFSVEIQPPLLIPVLLHHHYISLRPQCTPATSLALQGGAMYIVQGSTPVLQGGHHVHCAGGYPSFTGGAPECTMHLSYCTAFIAQTWTAFNLVRFWS